MGIQRVGCLCRFGLKTGIHFAHSGLESGMVFWGTTGVYEHIYLLSQGRSGGVVVYQYTRKKFAKIPQNTQNSSKYKQNYTQVYFKPEIQRESDIPNTCI